MPAAFVDAGAGFLTVSASADCAPVAPATVNAGDILIVHAFYGSNSVAPNTPSGYTLLDGPRELGTPATNGRVWVFGKVADGSEDGAAAGMGVQAVTTPRRGRVYRFTGTPSDTIGNIVLGFGFATAATAAVTDTSVTTTGTNSLACQLVAVADDNAIGAFTGESGGDWAEALAEYTSSTGTPDTCMQLQTATIASAGAIDGGSFTMSFADPWGVVGFYIKSAVITDVNLSEAVPITAISETPAAEIGPNAEVVAITAAALDATVEIGGASTNAPAEAAEATAIAETPAAAVDPSAEGVAVSATAETGAASVSPNAEAVGIAVSSEIPSASVSPNAEAVAIATAGNDSSTAVDINAEAVAITAAALDATVTTGSVTDAPAEAATATSTAEVASASVDPNAEAATVAASSETPAASIAPNAEAVAVTAAALDATILISKEVFPDAATVNATTELASLEILATAEAASALAAALDAIVSIPPPAGGLVHGPLPTMHGYGGPPTTVGLAGGIT